MARVSAMKNLGRMMALETNMNAAALENLGKSWTRFDSDTQLEIMKTLPRLVAETGSLRSEKLTQEMYTTFGIKPEEVEKLWLAMRYAHETSSQLDNLYLLRQELLIEFDLHEELMETRHRILHMMDKTINSTLKRYTSFIGPNHEGSFLDCFFGIPLRAPRRDPLEKNIDQALAEWNVYREDVPMHHFDEIVDLIFVGIISTMSYALTYSVKKESFQLCVEKVVDIVAVFFATYVLFICHTVSVIRFTYGAKWNTDLCHAIYGLGLIILAFVEKDSLSKNPVHIVAGLTLSAFSLLAIHAMFLIKKTVRGVQYLRTRIITFTLTLFLLIPVYIPSNTPFVNACLLVFAFVPPLVVELNSFRVEPYHLPVTVEHLCERFGMFAVFCLGESILATMNAFDGSFEHIAIMTFMFIIAFHMYKQMFVHWKSRVESHQHALFNHEKWGSCVWVFLHFLLGLFLTFNGFGFMFLMKGGYKYEHVTQAGLYYVMTFIPLTFLCLHLMRMCHVNGEVSLNSHVFSVLWMTTFVVVLFTFKKRFMEKPVGFCVCCCILVLLYYYGSPQMDPQDSKHEHPDEEDHSNNQNFELEHLERIKGKKRLQKWREDLQSDTKLFSERVQSLSPRFPTPTRKEPPILRPTYSDLTHAEFAKATSDCGGSPRVIPTTPTEVGGDFEFEEDIVAEHYTELGVFAVALRNSPSGSF